ncbi:amino acid permease-domain-containing protein [Aspergillus parasiticus]|uniref:Amino acid permease-domain-containing protein n=1 Tax=Aspergillus parasiticus TaxID=5067 RepID=A0A5N6DUT4_ASPPA|nr:amino acid permease-domain-containing protein [Aspergillus parasiticus]
MVCIVCSAHNRECVLRFTADADKPKHLIIAVEEGSIQIINSDAQEHFWGALAMNFTITAAPISIGSFLALTIGLGGPSFFLYGFLFIGLGQLVLCLAAAEIASSMPHPLVNPPKCRKVTDRSLSASLVFINGAALFVLITLLVRANPKQSATAVFVSVANNSGWGSTAVVFFLNVLPGLASLCACNAATHMAEELELPTRDVPQVMIGSALLNYLVAIPTMIIFLFCIVNPEAMLSPVGGQPLIQLIADGHASKVLTAIASALIVVGFAIGSWAALISWSRLYWSFSRTNGFPFSYFTEKTTDGVTVDALILGTILTIAIGAIQLGSNTALNAVLGGASLCSGFSWIVVFSFRVWRGNDALDPQRWLNLGKWGRPLSGFAILWNMWTIAWASFPLFLPVTLSSMNWSSLVAVGVVVISFVYYILFYRHRSDEME